MIVAQFLHSMGKSHLPSRAEMLDLPNAVLDGADCLQLSEDVMLGVDPIQCIQLMSKMCKEAEAAMNQPELYKNLSAMVFKYVLILFFQN